MTIRDALTNRNLTGERRRDAIIAAYCDEIGVEYTERDEDTAQAAQPDYSPASHQRTIAKRHGDMTGIGWPLQAMINTVNAAHAKIAHDWTCNFCGIAQPAWAGDCLTCETVPMMGDQD